MASPLGPILHGGPSLLSYDLTHATSGLPRYPAFDAGWAAGVHIIAPERVKITRHSGANYAGYSLYADGDSGLRYYITHLRPARAPVGSVVEVGGHLGTIGDYPGARVPHAHVGINVERLLGEGRELIHKDGYIHGAPTVGDQIGKLLKPKRVFAWPVPIPKWFWAWNAWKLNGGPRPKDAPRLIPPWAWRRRRAFLAARKKI